MNSKELLVPGAVVLLAVVLGWAAVNREQMGNPFQRKKALLDQGMELPVAWIYINDSDVNARHWGDFMGRSSRVLNLPFLNLCYESFMRKNGTHYRVEVIGGLQDLAVRLGGWEALPTPLQNPKAVVREPELNWIRAAVLAKWGGLWLSPATVWVNSLGPLPNDRCIFFGTDPDDTNSTEYSAPSLQVIWVPMAECPMMVDWEAKVRARLERRSGGSEFRHDEKTDAMEAIQSCPMAEIRTQTELSRLGPSRKRVQLEDLLASGTQGLHSVLQGHPKAAYVPIPYPEILEREAFGWFLRMSEDQILDSDLVLSHLFRITLSN